MQKIKDIIKIIIGIEVIALLGMLGIHLLMDMELKDMEIQSWVAIESFELDDYSICRY